MIWLSSSTLARLRDQLRTRGQRPSLSATPGASPDALVMEHAVLEYGDLCEAMFLMMSSDGKVSDDEREVLKGALRQLSSDTLRGAQVDALVERAAELRARDGAEARLHEVASLLGADTVRAEVAFVLSAALAFADGAIADQENETLNDLAEALGIDEAHASRLLDELEKEGAGARALSTPPADPGPRTER